MVAHPTAPYQQEGISFPMVTTYDTADVAAVQTQTPPIVAELQALFGKLDDSVLLEKLTGPTRRGPKGHPVRVLWHCFVTKYAMGLPSTAALIRTLVNNPFVSMACGIDSPDAIPHEATFSRFFAKLASHKILHHVKDVSRSMVRQHFESLPGFGERVAIDSTTLKGWSNGGKTIPSDPDAGWSVKTNSHGKTEFTWGYKLHLMVDCEYELPITANISAGNVHDSQRASNLLHAGRTVRSKFRPHFVMADKGYSGKPLIHLIRRQYGAQPVVDILPTHKKLMREFGDRMKTPEYRALSRQRQAVERAFSRLKGQRSLNNVTVRGLKKVTAHCYLSLIAMQAKA